VGERVAKRMREEFADGGWEKRVDRNDLEPVE